MIDAVETIVELLDGHSIPYMLVGSVASSLHGDPRTTRDIDVVVELDGASLDRLLSVIDPDRFYIPDPSARAAILNHSRFNVIDHQTGWKFDLIVRRDRPFSAEEFARRTVATIGSRQVRVATPEDTILAKLEWARLGGSERQIDDAVGVLRAGGARIDLGYLDRWAGELDVVDLLASARSRSSD